MMDGGGAQSSLAIDGVRKTGPSVRTENVMACAAIANVVKTSLGPIGLDKALVDDIGDVTITNDGATILRLLEVQHPAAKCLCDLANLQDQEVGDGTTSVVILAAELLKRANELYAHQCHPTTIIAGYRMACREAVRFVKEQLAQTSEKLSRDQLIAAACTSISSKVIGAEKEFFSGLCVDAMLRVRMESVTGKMKYPLKSINVLKQHGGSSTESLLVPGFALNCTVGSQQMPKSIKNAKIACIDFNLNRAKMMYGVSIQIHDPSQVEKFRQRENDIAKEHIQMILKTGANVVLTTKGIDDLALKYFVEANAMAVRRCTKGDLKRICRATGATLISSLVTEDGEEGFDAAYLGSAGEVTQTRIADDELILIKEPKNTCTASIILRGPNSTMLEEMDRSVHDCLCVIKRCLESNSLVAGGGAVETALNVHLEKFALQGSTREQLAVDAFAQALLVIPKQLAINAAKDATDLIAKLRACHVQAQASGDKNSSTAGMQHTGLDLVAGVVRNNVEAGVLEPAMAKVKMLQFATEAAITILRISDVITLNPRRRNPDDEDDCM